MTATALTVDDRQIATRSAGAPRLRLTAKHAGPTPSSHETRAHRGGSDAKQPVLIAGGDAAKRAQVHEELEGLLPGATRFEELGTFWQLLARAPESRAVILSGDLDEIPAELLLHTLAHRHPDLPVVSIGAAATATE